MSDPRPEPANAGPAVGRSYAACRRVARRAKSSFPLAFLVLPRPKRRAMDALYAFMRVTDDIVDGPGEPAHKKMELDDWRESLRAAVAGRALPPADARAASLLPALADAVRRFGVPVEYLLAVVDGVETDLEPVRFASFADLYPYLFRVASAVGLACLPIWGFRAGATPAHARAPAEAAGIAFQLTNVLRDLGEDYDNGRVYLPAEDTDRFGCPPEAWREPRRADGFRALMRFETERARDYYRRSESLADMLSADGRAIFRAMARSYRGLLDAIEAGGYDVLNGRVRLPRWRKASALLSAWPAKWGWW